MRFALQLEQKANEIRRARSGFPVSSRDNQNSQPNFYRHAGNQAIQSFFRSGMVQASLEIGHVNDPAEHEANEVASRIMGSPGKTAASPVRQAYDSSGLSGDPGVVEQVIRSAGHPLDPTTRSFFESRFGRDFGSIRVHTGSEAAESARAINALAYTAGTDIVFARGRYSPHTDEGKRLLAHELTHTVQHSARASTIVRRTPDLGGLTVSVAHTGTVVPISGAKVHIDQKNISSTKSIDLETDGSGNTPSIQLEEGNYTITVSYKCGQKTQDVHISGNVDQVTFFEFGRCDCGIASSDQNADGAVASADSNSLTPDGQANT